MKKLKYKFILIYCITFSIIASYVSSVTAEMNPEIIAVLPFELLSKDQDINLSLSIQKKIIDRLENRGLNIIPQETVNYHPLAFLPQRKFESFVSLGDDLGVRWLISGTITKIGESFSLDIQTVDISGLREISYLFITSENRSSLDDAALRIANSIFFELSDTAQIDSIIIQGNTRVETDAIMAVIDIKKGEIVDIEAIDKDLRNIYRMGYFNDVKIETENGQKGKIIIFTVTEKESIGKITFLGNKKINDDDLRKELGIRLYSILNRAEVQKSVNRLLEFYRQKAYYHASVVSDVVFLPDNEVELIYNITENDKTYVVDIQFSGNNVFKDSVLKGELITQKKGFFSFLTNSGLLNNQALEFDVYKLTNFYHDHGYIRAKVGEPSIDFLENKGLKVTYYIQEGEPYSVRNVSVEGDFEQTQEEMQAQLKIKHKPLFSRQIMRNDIRDLEKFFADGGYANTQVSPQVTEDDEEKAVDITYNVNRGARARFERINISGNYSTLDKIIRREFKAIEGDWFSGEAFRKSTANLHRLGYFKDIEAVTRSGSAEDQVIMDVNVEEQATGTFSVGVGYSTAYSAYMLLQVAEKNFLGRGLRAYADARIGTKNSFYDLRLVDPWFLDKEIYLSGQLYKWIYEFDDYYRDSTGGNIRLGIPAWFDRDYTKFFVEYGYDYTDIYDIKNSASTVIKEMEGGVTTSSVTFEILRNSKDKPWDTHSGSVNSISFKYAGGPLGGDQAFNEYKLDSQWFFSAPWNTVIMLRGRIGYMKERSSDGKLYSFQKYMLGGIDTVRGFDYRHISPKDGISYIGGEKMLVFNAELRIPLLEEHGVVGVVFFDAGNVFTKDENYTLSGIKKSAGLGFRWYSPMGPIRIEYAFVLGAKEDESSGKWEFMLGGEF